MRLELLPQSTVGRSQGRGIAWSRAVPSIDKGWGGRMDGYNWGSLSFTGGYKLQIA